MVLLKLIKSLKKDIGNDSRSDHLLQEALKYHQAGNLDKAETLYQSILHQNEKNADALNLYGVLKSQQTDYDSAIELLVKAIHSNDKEAIYYNNLGTVYFNYGNYDSAIINHEKALQIKPDFIDALFNKGNALYKGKQLQEALATFDKTLQLDPKHIDAAYNKALTLRDMDEYQQSIIAFKETLAIDARHTKSMNALARVYETTGDLENSLALYRKALEIDPAYPEANTNLLLNLNYQTDIKPEEIFLEHRNWALRHGDTPNDKAFKSHKRDPNKPLRIGYVSPDFRSHSVSYFIEPILSQHNKEKFTLFAYYTSPNKDTVTERLQTYFNHWRDVFGLTDDQLIQHIVDDEIDILVDLAGHTAHNRLLVFARKPAPVQITYLGYPNTTGLSAIDYRITDNFADPEGKTDRFYSEELLRLEHCFICYQQPADCPEINKLPALTRSYISFGCFNNATKINNKLLSEWARLLAAFPDSTLLLKSGQYKCELLRSRITDSFRENDIEPDRIEFAYHSENNFDHLGFYNQVDIALDTFPYNGTTTTCDALWMGVPVITLAGEEHRSRVGLSILSNAEMSGWIAQSPADMIEIARNALNNLENLNLVRQGLRNKLLNSFLMNSQLLTKNIEKSYMSVYENKTR